MGGCGQKWAWPFSHWILNSAVSQEWVDELSWFFACWYKFRKAKNYFNNFWVVVVKNGCGLLGHGTLKSADLKKELMNWADFLHVNTNLYVS